MASAFENILQGIEAELNSTIDAANFAASSANSATTEAQYNVYKSQYDQAVSRYDALTAEYEVTTDRLMQTLQGRMATARIVEVPNFKDRLQHFPGGTFGTFGQMPGGAIYSPVNTPEMKVGPVNVKNDFQLLSGSILEFLGYGFGTMEYLIRGGTLDLMFDDDRLVSSSREMTITTTAVNSAGQTLYSSTRSFGSTGDGGSSNFDSGFGSTATTGSMSLDAAARAWKNMVNIQGLVGMSPIMLGIALYDVFTGTEVNVEERIAGAMLGTIEATFTNMVSTAIAKMANVTAMSPAVMVGMGLVGTIVGELFEMALGLDTQFGYGGELVGVTASGEGIYGELEGGFLDRTVTGITDVFGELGGLLGGGGYTSAQERANYDALSGAINNDLATTTTTYSDIGITKTLDAVSVNITKRNEVLDGFSNLDKAFEELATQISTLGSFKELEKSLGLDGGPNYGQPGGDNSTGGDYGNTSGAGPGSPAGDGWSCFVAGTKVLVQMGSVREYLNIEDVLVGMKLVGMDGAVNTVLEYDRPISHGRPIYGFNGKQPFTTTEHMFLTVDGWKALVPEHAKQHHKTTFEKLGMDSTSELKVEDKLVLLDETVEVIKSINSIDIDYNTPLYNFKLDGNNTYIANGYIVHNK